MDNKKNETSNTDENIPATAEHAELSTAEQFAIDLENADANIESIILNPYHDDIYVTKAWIARAEITEKYLDSLVTTPENPKIRQIAQFDVMVDRAKVFERVGNINHFLLEMDSAEYFALNERLDDLVDINSITDILDAKISEFDELFKFDEFLVKSQIELILKLRGYISFENRQYLMDLIIDATDIGDFIGDIYGMIIDENEEVDPDEVLRSFGVIE